MLILFRFHDHYDVTLHNLNIVRRFNPAATIIGLYGGIESLNPIPAALRDAFDDVYIIPSDDPYWKWKNADLCVRQWYKDVGHKLSFDHVHLGEWDMLTLFNLNDLNIQSCQNAVTYRFSYAEAENFDWYWIRDTYEEWLMIKDYMTDTFQFTDYQSCDFGVMGGAFLCCDFLEKYADIYPPSYNNDEVRIGLFSKLWGIEVIDNNFKKLALNEYHTADSDEYPRFTHDYLLEGLQNGAKVLHPVREKLDID